ncbi:hypothetical protein QBC38DRAFT_482512 [Podospora fimiseda]|uniref:Uncharacterized protein n=1 Tax=Podospora fimiseda TaxID=252190 RepID=A0AAN7BLW9_9PEZI|nr:hypothetical protein QBC38DRAFT_482512 [Podospora fimiseda]
MDSHIMDNDSDWVLPAHKLREALPAARQPENSPVSSPQVSTPSSVTPVASTSSSDASTSTDSSAEFSIPIDDYSALYTHFSEMGPGSQHEFNSTLAHKAFEESQRDQVKSFPRWIAALASLETPETSPYCQYAKVKINTVDDFLASYAVVHPEPENRFLDRIPDNFELLKNTKAPFAVLTFAAKIDLLEHLVLAWMFQNLWKNIPKYRAPNPEDFEPTWVERQRVRLSLWELAFDWTVHTMIPSQQQAPCVPARSFWLRERFDESGGLRPNTNCASNFNIKHSRQLYAFTLRDHRHTEPTAMHEILEDIFGRDNAFEVFGKESVDYLRSTISYMESIPDFLIKGHQRWRHDKSRYSGSTSREDLFKVLWEPPSPTDRNRGRARARGLWGPMIAVTVSTRCLVALIPLGLGFWDIHERWELYQHFF